MRDSHFRHARNMSKLSDFKRSQIGCVVVCKNKVIASGFNVNKSHPIQRRYNMVRFGDIGTPHSMHAEINALAQIINNTDLDFRKVHLYTYREHKDGTKALARPCKSCMKLIKDLGIKHIHYTTDCGYAHEEIEA